MANIGCTIQELEWFPDDAPAIVDELPTGGTVNIQIWIDGNDVTPVGASGCNEINATGKYSWSTGNIASLGGSRVQYHYRMIDGIGNEAQGDFVLFARESDDGAMPSLNNQSSYIRQI